MTREHSPGGPYDAVTRLPDDKALEICKQIHPWRGEGDADADGNRNQENYLKLRRTADNWLCEQAASAGVRIDDRHPVAFAFTLDPEHLPSSLIRPRVEMARTTLSMKEIDSSNWSFTIGDSVTNYARAKEGRVVFQDPSQPVYGTVMNAAQFADALEKYKAAHDGSLPPILEAQMWATEPTFAAVPSPDANSTPVRKTRVRGSSNPRPTPR